MADIVQTYYEKLLDLVLQPSGKIRVETNFRNQVQQIEKLLKNDRTGLVSSVLEFMIHSATVDVRFDTQNSNLTDIYKYWKKNLNAKLNLDIPRGLRSFTEQYFRERWKSSLIVIKIRWSKINDYWMPTIMYCMDGGSIWIKNDKQNVNSNEYYFGNPDNKQTNRLKSTEDETILVRKPYNHWYDVNPTPYLIRKGTLYHSLFKTKILDRQAELLNTAIPYQFFVKVGCEEAMRRGVMPTPEDLEKWKTEYQGKKTEERTHEWSKGLTGSVPFDVNFEELIPDYTKLLDEKVVKSTDRNILSSLGMIELKGFSSDREEAILNPKVLVEEVTDGVLDYLELLEEIVALTKEKNANAKKYNNADVNLSPGIIKAFITDNMRVLIRSWYDRGLISKKSAVEDTTQLNFEVEIAERDRERKDELNKRCYPPVIMNIERDFNDPSDPGNPEETKEKSPEKKKTEKDVSACEETDLMLEPMKTIRSIPDSIRAELKTKEQAQIFKQAFNECIVKCQELEMDSFLKEKTALEFAWHTVKMYMEAPYKTNSDLPENVKNALPAKAQSIFRNAFNSAMKQGKSEEVAFKIAWSAVKQSYKKVKDQWVKK